MMRWLTCLSVLLASLLLVQAEGPDDMYVRIYYLIQEADSLNEKGDVRPAVAKYMEAQSALRNLKMLHPDWNEKVVNFRLNYIASKLDPLMQRGPAAPSTPPIALTPPAPITPTNPPAPPAPDVSEIKALQDEIARLTGQNALLEAKLKEAWSVQPPATDPRELAKAQQRVQDLEKERDLLRVSLEQEKGKLTNSVDSVLAQERQVLAEVKQKLAQQEQLSTSMQIENQGLKQQNQELKSQTDALVQQNQTLTQQVAALTLKLQSVPAAAPSPALAGDPSTAALQASNVALRMELLLMEARMADVSQEAARARSPKDQRMERELSTARATARALERDRAKLQKQLERVSRELAKRGGPTVPPPPDAKEQQLEIARARLAFYEAKSVPYTAGELALFRQRDLLATVAASPETKTRVKEVPTGAGPLIAAAERAEQNGQLADAEKGYLQVLNQDTNNLYTLSRLAAVQVDQNRLDEANKTLQRALAIDPQDWRCLFVLGHLRAVQGKPDEAVDALAMSAKLNPEKAETFYFLGLALVDKGQRQAAEAALRKAIQIKPNWGQAHYQLAAVYATQQPPFKELAQWHYQRAVAAGAPRSPDLEKFLEEKK